MNTFKSQFNIGDKVNVLFPNNGILKDCRVAKVSFSNGATPRYDLDVPFDYVPNFNMEDTQLVSGTARIHSIKEWHLRDPQDAISDRLLPDTADEK